MEHIGKVVSIDGEIANLEIKRVSGCATSCSSCPASCDQKAVSLSLPNLVGAKEGDLVEIEMDTNFIIRSMMRVYGIPLVLFILTIGLSSKLDLRQIISFGLGALSFVASFFILRFLDKKQGYSNQAEIVKILK